MHGFMNVKTNTLFDNKLELNFKKKLVNCNISGNILWWRKVDSSESRLDLPEKF
jgi:hypothetical protein